MLKKCLKGAFSFFIVFSLIIGNSHFDYFGVSIVFALPSSVSVKGTKVNVRSGPGTDYKILGTVVLGYKLTPLDSVKDASNNGKNWYKFNYNNETAYIRTDFCKELTSYTYDATFEADMKTEGFPDSYLPGLRDLHANYPNWIFKMQRTGLDFNYAVENELVGTRTLVTSGAISSYKSTDTGKYDWTTSKWPTFDGGAWVCASKEVTKSFMDPRNFLYDPYIFQFELQTFNVTIHTLEGIKEMVKGTFLDANVETAGLTSNAAVDTSNTITSNVIMPWEEAVTPLSGFTDTMVVEGGPGVATQVLSPNEMIEAYGPGAGVESNSSSNTAAVINSDSSTVVYEATSYDFTYLPKGTYSYSELIYDACKQVNCNPYVIVSMILQEQGKSGTDSVSGTNKKYKGIYNYGNINSFASNGLTAIENGLKYASESGTYNRPWNSKEKGIYGLCDFYANSYVKVGQDTFYLKKWNVQGTNMFKHQYMTNVAGAASEGQILGNSYDQVLMQMPHEFKIPIYSNMPEENCAIPTKDGSPNNKLKSLSVTNYVLTPTFDTDTNDYSIIIDSNVNQVYINAEAYDSRAAVGGIGYINTTTTNTYAIIYCVAENKDIRQYNINIYKKGVENVLPTETTYDSSQIIIFPTPDIVVEDNTLNQVESYGPQTSIQTNNNYGNLAVQVGVGPG